MGPGRRHRHASIIAVLTRAPPPPRTHQSATSEGLGKAGAAAAAGMEHAAADGSPVALKISSKVPFGDRYAASLFNAPSLESGEDADGDIELPDGERRAASVWWSQVRIFHAGSDDALADWLHNSRLCERWRDHESGTRLSQARGFPLLFPVTHAPGWLADHDPTSRACPCLMVAWQHERGGGGKDRLLASCALRRCSPSWWRPREAVAPPRLPRSFLERPTTTAIAPRQQRASARTRARRGMRRPRRLGRLRPQTTFFPHSQLARASLDLPTHRRACLLPPRLWRCT